METAPFARGLLSQLTLDYLEPFGTYSTLREALTGDLKAGVPEDEAMARSLGVPANE